MKIKLTHFLLFSIIITQLVLVPGAWSQSKADSTVSSLNEKVAGFEERISNAEADLSKLTKIKLSGYIQAQWQNFENPSVYPSNYFSIRRARIKFVYEPSSGIAFVLQPDLVPGGLSLKDAYVQVNDPWLKTFSLWAGQFNRPNYEVEYSSGSREIAERSLMERTLYPGERAIGVKLEVNPRSIPLKIQLALLNGNDGLSVADPAGVNINPVNKDLDNHKDIMARATYAFKLGNLGGLNIGAHGYFGGIKAASATTLNGDYSLNTNTQKIGSVVKRTWFGVEAQLYLDVIGGLTLKGEYIMGKNASAGSVGTSTITSSPVLSYTNDTLFSTTTVASTTTIKPNFQKNFQGYYIFLIKNITKKHQLAIRYDYFDPNTDLKGSDIGVVRYDGSVPVSTKTDTRFSGTPVIGTSTITSTETINKITSGTPDIAYGTIAIAWNYYFSDNIKLMINYDIPMNEKVGKNAAGTGNVISKYTVNNIPGTLDYSSVFPQNLLTVRLQVKF